MNYSEDERFAAYMQRLRAIEAHLKRVEDRLTVLIVLLAGLLIYTVVQGGPVEWWPW
jgi:hypothetical protein